jgi:hypothetical protein
MKLTTNILPKYQQNITVEIQTDAEELTRPIVAYFETQPQAGVRFTDGQTVQFGWLLLLLRQADDNHLEVFEPDFDCVPIRWCRGINNAVRHLSLQRAVCALFGCEPLFPTISQAGITSPKFFSSVDYTMSRDTPADSDSGWVFAECDYAGAEGEFCSLYQLSLQKPEVIPFLALPPSSRITFKPGFREITANTTTRSSADNDLLRKLAAWRNSVGSPQIDEQIIWTGDLDDDCTARWAGLMLRAEWMDGAYWWWAVSEIATGRELASSNDDRQEYTSGTAARSAAERIARAHIHKL